MNYYYLDICLYVFFFYGTNTDHFDQAHHPCKHPTCQEQKFVVFLTEQELKQHTAREHGDTMSKAEKKAAMAIPVAFTVRCFTVYSFSL